MFSTYSTEDFFTSKNAIDIYQQKWFPFATAAQLETILTLINFANGVFTLEKVFRIWN